MNEGIRERELTWHGGRGQLLHWWLVTMSEYDSSEDLEAQVCDVYDESRPRWHSSLRDKPEDTKPAWSLARKRDSPSVRSYAEGGSLATARQRPREPCAKRQ